MVTNLHQQRKDALLTEHEVFEQLKGNLSNPKKLIKAVHRLIPSAPQYIQDGMLAQLLVAKDPIKFLKESIQKLEDFKWIIKDLIESGNHGMIIVKESTNSDKETIYPIKLDTRENWLKENQFWDCEQEMLIQHELAEGWMREHDRPYFFGKVVLFKEFGFTGIPRVIEMKCSKDTKNLKRYPGTNYFYKG